MSSHYDIENHKRRKKSISQAYMYFKENYERYNTFRNFVYKSSISDNQAVTLRNLGKPIIEANILEAYISRQLGEFVKHEPSINVYPADGQSLQQEVIDTVENHIRHIIYEANKNNMDYEVYKDTLSGGFSVLKVWTDYISPHSFKQNINVSRVFDPTLCGFDPMARHPHKADANYCFEIFPITEDEFKENYPNANISNISYMRSLEDFSWSYKSIDSQKIVLIADYYEKKKKKLRIVELSDGQVISAQEYEKLKVWWQQNQILEQIPIVKQKRWTTIEIICRYKLNEVEILEYEETDYSYLPYVFVDGNSVILTQGSSNSSSYQMTRPYIYQAKGIQELKNFSMQCLGNYLENMVQHKFIIKKEALPQEEDYIDAINDHQHANTLIVNAYSENNPDKPIPEPIREVQVMPAPPEIMNAFQISDATTQTILGSFASNIGRDDTTLSGKAIIESATNGNAAAMPYVVGFLSALTQVGCIIVDLIPKYYKGEREIPLMTPKGEKNYQVINAKGAPNLKYNENSLNIKIEAGVNFQIQKNQALQQITALMAVSQEFNEFMNSPKGLPILVKNLTVYGSDELQSAVPEFLEERKQQQAQQQQMQAQLMQNNPQMIRAQAELQKSQVSAQESQAKIQQMQFDNQIQIAKTAIEKEIADAKILEAESKITQQQIDSAVRLEEAQTSLEVHALESAAKFAEIKDREKAREKIE